MNGTGDWGAEPENDPENAEANRSMQAHATVDQSLDSTRRMMSNLYETEETGNKTMEMLNDQGEQLHRIEQGIQTYNPFWYTYYLLGMDTVNRDMREAEKHLTALERCCGCCTCPSQKVDSFEDNEGYASTWNRDENTVVTNAPGRTGNNASGTRSDNQQMIQKITGDEREDEMEQNLQLV